MPRLTDEGRKILRQMWLLAVKEDSAAGSPLSSLPMYPWDRLPSSEKDQGPAMRKVRDFALSRGVSRYDFNEDVVFQSSPSARGLLEIGEGAGGMLSLGLLPAYLESQGIEGGQYTKGHEMTGAYDVPESIRDKIANIGGRLFDASPEESEATVEEMFTGISPLRAVGGFLGGGAVAKGVGAAMGRMLGLSRAAAAIRGTGLTGVPATRAAETTFGFGVAEYVAEPLRQAIRGEEFDPEAMDAAFRNGILFGLGFEALFRGVPALAKMSIGKVKKLRKRYREKKAEGYSKNLKSFARDNDLTLADAEALINRNRVLADAGGEANLGRTLAARKQLPEASPEAIAEAQRSFETLMAQRSRERRVREGTEGTVIGPSGAPIELGEAGLARAREKPVPITPRVQRGAEGDAFLELVDQGPTQKTDAQLTDLLKRVGPSRAALKRVEEALNERFTSGREARENTALHMARSRVESAIREAEPGAPLELVEGAKGELTSEVRDKALEEREASPEEIDELLRDLSLEEIDAEAGDFFARSLRQEASLNLEAVLSGMRRAGRSPEEIEALRAEIEENVHRRVGQESKGEPQLEVAPTRGRRAPPEEEGVFEVLSRAAEAKAPKRELTEGAKAEEEVRPEFNEAMEATHTDLTGRALGRILSNLGLKKSGSKRAQAARLLKFQEAVTEIEAAGHRGLRLEVLMGNDKDFLVDLARDLGAKIHSRLDKENVAKRSLDHLDKLRTVPAEAKAPKLRQRAKAAQEELRQRAKAGELTREDLEGLSRAAEAKVEELQKRITSWVTQEHTESKGQDFYAPKIESAKASISAIRRREEMLRAELEALSDEFRFAELEALMEKTPEEPPKRSLEELPKVEDWKTPEELQKAEEAKAEADEPFVLEMDPNWKAPEPPPEPDARIMSREEYLEAKRAKEAWDAKEAAEAAKIEADLEALIEKPPEDLQRLTIGSGRSTAGEIAYQPGQEPPFSDVFVGWKDAALVSGPVGQPVSIKTFRGEGVGATYGEGVSGPALGPGRYSSLLREYAAEYGEVKELTVELENPFVITQDKDLLSLSGYKKMPSSNSEREEMLREVRNMLEDRGHDGAIINVPIYTDLSWWGGSAKRLAEIFDASTAVEFEEPGGEELPIELGEAGAVRHPKDPDKISLADLIRLSGGLAEGSLKKPDGDWIGELRDIMPEKGSGSVRSLWSQKYITRGTGGPAGKTRGVGADEVAQMLNDDPALSALREHVLVTGGKMTGDRVMLEDIVRMLPDKVAMGWTPKDMIDNFYKEETERAEQLEGVSDREVLGPGGFEDAAGIEPFKMDPLREGERPADMEPLPEGFERPSAEAAAQGALPQGQLPGMPQRKVPPSVAKRAEDLGLESTPLTKAAGEQARAESQIDITDIKEGQLISKREGNRLGDIAEEVGKLREVINEARGGAHPFFSPAEIEGFQSQVRALEAEAKAYKTKRKPSPRGEAGPDRDAMMKWNKHLHALEEAALTDLPAGVRRVLRRQITGTENPFEMGLQQQETYRARLKEIINNRSAARTAATDDHFEAIGKARAPRRSPDPPDEVMGKSEVPSPEDVLPPDLTKDISFLATGPLPPIQTPQSELGLSGRITGKLLVGEGGGPTVVPPKLREYFSKPEYIGATETMRRLENENFRVMNALRDIKKQAKMTVKDGRDVFRALDGQMEPAQLAPHLLDAYRESRNLLNSLAVRLKLEPEARITEYMPHIFRGRLGEMMAQQLAGDWGMDISEVAIKTDWRGRSVVVPRVPRAILFRHLLTRKGTEGFEMDWDAAMTVYVQGALRKIHMDPWLEEAAELIKIAGAAKDKPSSTSALQSEMAEYAYYITGGTTNAKKALAANLSNSHAFDAAVDRAMALFAPGKTAENLGLVRDPKKILEWYRDLVEQARMPDEGPGALLSPERMARWRANVALDIDDMRSRLQDPDAGPVVMNKMYRTMVWHKLGLNLAHFVTNSTQFIINSVPEIGPTAAARGVWRMFNYSAGGQRGQTIQVGKVETSIKWLMDQVDPLIPAAREFLATEGMGGKMQSIEKVVLAPSRWSEKWMRYSTLVGKYESALEGLGELPTTDPARAHEVAFKKAWAAQDKALFVFNRSATPKTLRSPLAQILLMFQSYTAHQVNFTLEKFVGAGREGSRRAKGVPVDPADEGAMGRLALHLAGYLLVMGLPEYLGYNASERYQHPVAEIAHTAFSGHRFGEPALISLAGGPYSSLAYQTALWTTGHIDFAEWANRALTPSQIGRTMRGMEEPDNLDALMRTVTGLRRVRKPGLGGLGEAALKSLGRLVPRLGIEAEDPKRGPRQMRGRR